MASTKSRSGSETRKRTIVLTARFNRQEAEALRKTAAAADITVGSLLRQNALNVPLRQDRAVDREAVGRLLGQIGHLRGDIGKIGSNLNQLTKYANMGRTLENSIEAVLRELIPVFERDLLELRLACLQALGREPRRNHPAQPKTKSDE